MENWIEIISIVLSALATIIATFKKSGTTKTAEDIEATAEQKKQKYIAKQLKKNHLKSESKSETTKVSETSVEDTSTGYLSL